MFCRINKLLILALTTLGIAACSPESNEAIDVTVIGTEEPSLADPSTEPLKGPDRILMANAAQGLVRFDARGQIEPGLAETWNVSDDGLSYIFRLAATDWPDGKPIVARDVARILNRQLRSASRNELKDTLGAVEDIVAMTDRVIEVRLRAPRPYLLQLLAQPEFGLVRQGWGSGPFQPDAKQQFPDALTLTRTIRIVDDKDRIERIRLRTAAAKAAIGQFQSGKTAIVLGGTFVNLPLVPRDRRTGNALRFDPVAGLFGLAPARGSGPIADKELRDLLNRTINREALIAALDIPNLLPRTTVLQGGIESGANPVPPAWAEIPFADRYAAAVRKRPATDTGDERLKLAIELPEGPGATILFDRLRADWYPLGIDLVRAGKGVPADLTLIDEVAPSSSRAWFVRTFRCSVASICSTDADELMGLARETLIPGQRTSMLTEAGRMIDEEVLFLPIGAPVRWSLVADDLPGFAENNFAIHPLSGLRDKPVRERQ